MSRVTRLFFFLFCELAAGFVYIVKSNKKSKDAVVLKYKQQ